MALALEHWAGRVSPRFHRRPAATLVVVAMLTAAAFFGVRRLSVETDLTALLPERFDSVRDLNRLREKIGATGFVLVVARANDTDALRRFADDAAEKLSALERVDFVQHRRSTEFFRSRALYYLETEDIEEITDRIDETIRWHKKQANPLFVDLEDSKPPSLDFSHLKNRHVPLERTISGSGGDYFLAEGGKLIVLFVRPTEGASDFRFTQQVMADVQSALGKMDASAYGDLRIELGGRYKKRLEQQSIIEGDLGRTSGLALALLVGFVVLHFRRWGAVPLLLGPLVIALFWLLGLTGILFGQLNILTAFVGTILLGMGIDHGIHFLGRYQFERQQRASVEEAIERTFSQTGRGVLLAGLTTAVGFLGLAVSRFRAFQEFGIIAGLGILLVVVAYFVVLPAGLALLGRWVEPTPTARIEPTTSFVRLLLRQSTIALALSSAVFFGLGMASTRAEFDYDFRTLEGGDIPAYALDEIVDRIVGRNQTPIVILADDVDAEAAAAESLRKRVEAATEASRIDFVVAAGDVVPDQQDDKAERIEELRDVIAKVPEGRVDDDDRARLDELREMAEAEPFGLSDVPIAIRRQFKERGVVLVFPRVSLSDGKAVMALAKEVRGIPLPGDKAVSAAGGVMIMADILDLVTQEAPIVTALTFALVFVAMWVLLGELRLAVFCLAPAVVTVAATIGGAGLVGLKLNYLNVVVLPVLFGMAVDAGVHLVIRGSLGGESFEMAVAETSRAVWAAAVTTAAGFGALLLAHHPGLRSFGQLALIGLSAMLGASIIWLVALIGVRRPRR